MKFIKIVLFVMCLMPLLSVAQVGYNIKCKVGKLNSPAKAFLKYKIAGEEFLDSTLIENGKFEFIGKVGAPHEAHIMVQHDGLANDPTMLRTFDVLGFFIEDSNITITSKDSICNAKISGSELNEQNTQVTALLKPLYEKLDVLNKEFEAQPESKQWDPIYIKSLEDRASVIQEEIVGAKFKYAETHPNSYMAIVALNSTMGPEFDAVAAEKIFNQLSLEVKNTELGQASLEKILSVKSTQKGVKAPDFTQNDANGNPVKLSDFRGKYVLLDFWASWCSPCRRENPNLVKTYKTYKDKGFEILAVSLDKPGDKDKWLKAVEHDGLLWTQVSDLKGWDNEVSALYDVKAIPMNFLIDPNGIIIAKYLRGEELDAKLKELFK
ncbi:redoxin domain-containing protein [Labilibaculum euxinus]